MNYDQESAIAEFLQILEEHRKNCEEQGKYIEAEIAKKRLDDLRLHEDNRKREAMRARQIAERLGVEEAHMLEFQQFNKNWDQKVAANEEAYERLIKAMQERHEKELLDYQKILLAKQQQRTKFSTELLNLRKIQEHLAKAKDYTEAQKIKTKADALEAVETKRGLKRRQKEITQQEIKFQNSKNQEMAALQKRVESGRKELNKKRQNELERLLQRYQNVKNELEAQQNLERMRSEKMSQSSAYLLQPRRSTCESPKKRHSKKVCKEQKSSSQPQLK